MKENKKRGQEETREIKKRTKKERNQQNPRETNEKWGGKKKKE